MRHPIHVFAILVALLLLLPHCGKDQPQPIEVPVTRPSGPAFEAAPASSQTVSTTVCNVAKNLTIEIVGTGATCTAITAYVEALQESANRALTCPPCPSAPACPQCPPCTLNFPASLLQKFEQKLDREAAFPIPPPCTPR